MVVSYLVEDKNLVENIVVSEEEDYEETKDYDGTKTNRKKDKGMAEHDEEYR